MRVPSELAPEQLHAAVRDIPLPVCPSCQDRARRLLHALSTAAEREHFTLSPTPSETRACLSISTGPSVFRLFLEESTEQALDPAELKYSWQRVTASTERPTHHLDLRLEHSWAQRGRRGRWGDRQRWSLEDRLPDVLQEIAHRARIEHQRQLEQRQREEETERRWHAAMDRARTEFLEAHRLAQLHKQVAAWQEAALVRAYCDALEQHLRQSITDDESEASTRRWIAWARSWTDRTDPALRSPGFPEDPQATAADLSPYLHGWSPYGPKMR